MEEGDAPATEQFDYVETEAAMSESQVQFNQYGA